MRKLLFTVLFLTLNAKADIHYYTVFPSTKLAMECESIAAKDYTQWRNLIYEVGNDMGLECGRDKDADYLVLCKSKNDKSEKIFVGNESKESCEQNLKEAKSAQGLTVLSEKEEPTKSEQVKPQDNSSLTKKKAMEMYDKSGCSNLKSFVVKKKIESNKYEITSVYQGLTHFNGIALLETSSVAFKSTGRVFDLRVQVMPDKTITLSNGFTKKVPHLVESKDCDNYYRTFKSK